MKRLLVVEGILFLLVILLVPEITSAIGLEVAVGGWRQDPSGDIAYKGEKLSVENELKYDSENRIFGRAKIDLPLWLPNIYLMATPMKFEEEEGVKNINFTFGDKTFAANVPFKSSVRADHYDICLYYGLPFLKKATFGKLNIELGLNGRIIDFEAKVDQPTTGIKESKSLTFAVPMAYGAIQIKPVKFLAVEAEGRGVAYSSNHYYDLIGRLKIKPFKVFFLSGGYRYESVKIDEKDVKATLKFKGPFAEAGIEF
ncbi:MAG: TIGR04219 family outer membrane beta-barrel protein [Syntrophaceae bacterium]|nr:TIGR04219 family outer membrane beta-barrel protein [Syntrophaceae bacterium]